MLHDTYLKKFTNTVVFFKNGEIKKENSSTNKATMK